MAETITCDVCAKPMPRIAPSPICVALGKNDLCLNCDGRLTAWLRVAAVQINSIGRASLDAPQAFLKK